MFSLVTDGRRTSEARELLARALRRSALHSTHDISTPGGVVEGADIYRHKQADMWGHVAAGLWNDNRYFCGFGIGEPSWQVAIEINIPVTRLLSCSGQIVEDTKGNFYYAHRGGLGGGKFSVRAAHFADLIRGFEREPVSAGSKELNLFILGRIDALVLPEGLAAYVHEAARIRDLRRAGKIYSSTLRGVGVPLNEVNSSAGDDFEAENDHDGVYSVQRQIAFRRLHAKVQRALARELKKMGLAISSKRLSGGIAPDLFLKDNAGAMSTLFEIKIPPGAQSTFTAIGQLAVYSCGQKKKPKKILVSRGLPRSNLFSEAFSEHNISHLLFEMDENDRVTFPGIANLSF